MRVKIINKSTNPNPSFATDGSAGLDLKSNVSDIIYPNQRVLIKTGLFLEIPIGYECQIRPRSGLALNHGITVLNSPGTIDSDYRGEIGVILYNSSNTTFQVSKGDKVAQMVFAKYERPYFESVDELSETERGFGGFGSTGK